MKQCFRCKIDKNDLEFNKNKRGTAGLNSWCKECRRSYDHIRHQRPDVNIKAKARSSATRHRNRMWLLEYKSKLKCSICEESDSACLDFHHIDPTQKMVEVATLVNTRCTISTIQNEISKCIILCANCHRKLHYRNKLLK